MKRFAILRIDGSEYLTTSRAAEFRNAVLVIRGQGLGAEFRFFADGHGELSSAEAVSAAEKRLAAEYQKKLKTHREIFVKIGASGLPGTIHRKWVRRYGP